MSTEIDAGAEQLIAATRTRAIGAGLDPNQYEQVTSTLTELAAWTPTLTAVALEHARSGESAEQGGHLVTAGESHLAAARWAHFATCWPNPDRDAHAQAAGLSAGSYRAALRFLDPSAVWIESQSGSAPFVGVLRHPPGVVTPPLVLLICGLDSSKEEFHYVAEALLRRGLAVFAFDGPGQGQLAASTVIEACYETVVAHVLDTLTTTPALDVDLTRVGIVALSLGGFYGLRAAAAEPRVRALVTVSGVSVLPWDALPSDVRDTLVQRIGDVSAARRFADAVDAAAAAASVAVPLLVVAGEHDPIPTLEQAQSVVAAAPHGHLHTVAGGDHLAANRHWLWLGMTTDWLVDQLADQVDDAASNASASS
jgi:pimeloyl-ACP methyl ester carboxylesterase